jgi:RNA polymerase sigma factor for flagellar operon FliA
VVKTDVEALWRRYAVTRDQGARKKIIEAHVPRVRRIARGLKKRLPAHVDVEDLVSAGYVGLVDAVDKFDQTRATFGTYCEETVRGAMLDAIRSDDWVPRVVRRRSKELVRVQTELEAELGRKPTNREMAARMGVTLKTLRRVSNEAVTKVVLSLERNRPEDDTMRFVDIIEDRTNVDSMGEMSRGDVHTEAMKGLVPKERAVIEGLFFEGKTEVVVAGEMGISESRVSQIKIQALAFLRKRFNR